MARIRAAVKVPVIANGEIRTPEDYARCREVSGCADVMIGRGAVADPFLARNIRNRLPLSASREADWPALQELLANFWHLLPQRMAARYRPGRLKLWLGSLRQCFPEADALYHAVRPLRTIEETEAVLETYGILAQHRKAETNGSAFAAGFPG